MDKSSSAIAKLNIPKDIDIVRRGTSPAIVGDVTTCLHVSLITSPHLVEGSTSIEAVVRRLSSVDSPTVIPGVTRVRSVRTVVCCSLHYPLLPRMQHPRHYHGCYTGDGV